MADDQSNNITAVANFISQLTGTRIWNAFLAGLIGVAVYTLYENRSSAFPYILNSPWILTALGVGLLISIFAMVTVAMVKRVQEVQDAKNEYVEKQITTLKAELDACRNDCREAQNSMLLKIWEKLNEK